MQQNYAHGINNSTPSSSLSLKKSLSSILSTPNHRKTHILFLSKSSRAFPIHRHQSPSTYQMERLSSLAAQDHSSSGSRASARDRGGDLCNTFLYTVTWIQLLVALCPLERPSEVLNSSTWESDHI